MPRRAFVSPKSLPRRFLAATDACGVPRGARILAAFSGGPDSTALLTLLLRVAPERGWKISAAHFNHRTRGRASLADEAFARRFCAACRTRLLVKRRAGGRSPFHEEELREMRLAFLEKTAAKVNARYIATGHQRDDLAETFLLRLLRGAGSAGLAGIASRARRGALTFVRPLLAFTRKEILAWLAAEGVPFRTDATNASLERARNRVRRTLLPLLARDFNPNIAEDLARTAEILREEDAFLDEAASRALRGARGAVSIEILKRAPLALRRRMARLLIARARGHLRGISFAHIESVLGLLESGGEAHLPGWLTVKREGKVLKYVAHDTQRPTSRRKSPR